MKPVMKRVLAAALAVTAVITPVSGVYAEPADQTDTETTQSAEKVQSTETDKPDDTTQIEEPAPINPEAETGTEGLTIEEAREKSYGRQPESNSIPGWPQGPQVYGNAAIVMDVNSGAILYAKSIDDKHYPASITKMMTALVALENSTMDDEVLFSQDSIDILEWDYASIGMTPGEILSMEDAMYGMLLASANEVAYAIAESVGNKMGGGYEAFIREMNDRAVELGCTGSHWVNPNGLFEELHYTTAHDMALITSELCKHPEVFTIMQTLNYTIGPTNLMDESRTFQQNHKMLWPGNSKYYEYCTGGKTGFVDESRTTLVTTADNGTLQLAAVVLRDDGNSYDDTRAMLDYAFGNFSKVMLKEQTKPDEVRSYTEDDAYVLLPAGIEFSSLDHEITITDEREASGRITYYYEGQNVGSTDVTLTPEYVEETTGYTNRMEPSGEAGNAADADEAGGFHIPGWMIPILVVAGIIAAGLVLLIIRVQIIRAKRRRRALMRRRRRQQMQRRRAVERRPQGRPQQRQQQRQQPPGNYSSAGRMRGHGPNRTRE